MARLDDTSKRGRDTVRGGDLSLIADSLYKAFAHRAVEHLPVGGTTMWTAFILALGRMDRTNLDPGALYEAALKRLPIPLNLATIANDDA